MREQAGAPGINDPDIGRIRAKPSLRDGDGMEPGADVSIRTEGLARTFGDVTAVDGVDLALEGPQIVGIAGPNGAGKSTLLRIVLGLIKPTSGTSRVNGVPSLELTAADRRRIGYMPQNRAIYQDLSVRGNVEFFAQLYGMTDRDAATDAVLEIVDLADRGESLVSELSGGMIRRASLASALVHDPDILMLDEPTVGLDPALRAEMWQTFRERRDKGTLILISTHYLGEARHCDEVLFLRDGQVLDLDTPQAFLERTGTEDLEDAFLELLRADGDSGIERDEIERSGGPDP
jgi:ABC-2 type transport system ATP-binding protein